MVNGIWKCILMWTPDVPKAKQSPLGQTMREWLILNPSRITSRECNWDEGSPNKLCICLCMYPLPLKTLLNADKSCYYCAGLILVTMIKKNICWQIQHRGDKVYLGWLLEGTWHYGEEGEVAGVQSSGSQCISSPETEREQEVPQSPPQCCTSSIIAPPLKSSIGLLKQHHQLGQAEPLGTSHIQTTAVNVIKLTCCEYFNKQITYK